MLGSLYYVVMNSILIVKILYGTVHVQIWMIVLLYIIVHNTYYILNYN